MQHVRSRRDDNHPHKRTRGALIVILLYALLFLTACGIASSSTAHSNEWTDRWLQGTPCRAPCWEGIRVGKTTATEMAAMLRHTAFVSTAEIITSTVTPNISEVDWTWSDDQLGGRAFYNAQTFPHTINMIQVNYPTDFSLRDVIGAYGPPSHIIATASKGGFVGESDPERLDYSLMIVYMQQGFILSANVEGKPILNEDLRVIHPVFFPPNEQGFTSLFPLHPPEELVPWQGFKDFAFYCRDWDAGRICQAPPRSPFRYWPWFALGGTLIIVILWMTRRWRRRPPA